MPRKPRRPLTFARMRTFVQAVHLTILGSLVALPLTAWLVSRSPYAPEASPELPSDVLVMIGGVLSLVSVAIAVLVLVQAKSHLRGASVAMRLQGSVFARTLVAASLEGAGLYWSVLVLLFGDPMLLIGAAVSFAILLAMFPTTGRIEEDVEMSEAQIERALAESQTP